MELERIMSVKIAGVSEKLAALGKPIYRPKLEFRRGKHFRVELDSPAKAIIFLNIRELTVMPAGILKSTIINLILDILQLIHFGSTANNLDRAFLQKLL